MDTQNPEMNGETKWTKTQTHILTLTKRKEIKRKNKKGN